MADISVELAAILAAVYGEDVRGSIHDAIEKINDVSEVVLTLGTAVTGPTSSSSGFYDGSLYLNTSTYELWECVGVDSWASQGILKGDAGTPGADGNKWYLGTNISGKAVLPTVYSGSGITYANANDFYLNPVEGAVYHCVSPGDASTATWSYDFTMSGGGGGTTYTAGNGIDISIADVISVDSGSIASGETKPPTAGDVYTALQSKANTGDIPTTLASLTGDVSISTPSNDQVLKYNGTSSKWENAAAPSGGHTMIPVSGDMAAIAALNNGSDNYVINAYSAKRWANCEAKEVLTTASQNADGVGTWDDDATWETGSRSGWLWSSELYQVLEDGNGNTVLDIDISPIFDIGKSETVGLLSYRIDDDYSYNGTPGGCVAFKFTGAIKNANGVKVGLKLVHQRTEVNDGTILT